MEMNNGNQPAVFQVFRAAKTKTPSAATLGVFSRSRKH